jgi:hypothetical protein
MSDVQDSKAVRINSGALLFLTTLASLIAAAPVAVTLGRPAVLVILAVALPVVLWLQTRTYHTVSTEAPTFWDFTLGAVGALFYPVTMALMWLVAYWALYGLSGGLEWVVNYFGGGVHWGSGPIAFWPTVVLGIPIMLLAAILSQDTLFEQLYPNVVGVKSAFYDLIHFARRNLIVNTILTLAAIGALVAVALLTGAGLTGWWFNLGLLVILFVASAPLYDLGVEKAAHGHEHAIEAVARLLRAGGYDVVQSPRTGRDDVDPLLAEIDIFAESEQKALVAVVHVAGKHSDPPDWRFARDLLPAAWAMERHLGEQSPDSAPPVELLLVLVGQQADVRLRDYAEERYIRLSDTLEGEMIAQILEESDPAALAVMFEQHLNYQPVASSRPPSNAPADTGGTL